VPQFASIESKKNELIRKSLRGAVFLAPRDADPIEKITDETGSLKPLPLAVGPATWKWSDLGLLSGDGASFGGDRNESNVSSWGQTTPTRTDIVSDTTTLTVLAQETSLLTIGLYTGADLSGVTPDAGGEVGISKPSRPASRSYRALAMAVDQSEDGEIYVARFLPNAKTSGKADQKFGEGDDPIGWGVTFTGQVDDELGYSERWMFGGPGWLALLSKMGFKAAAAA